LPADHARTGSDTHSASWKEMVIAPEMVRDLQSLARAARSTVSNTLMAAFQILLYRYSQQSDFAMGVPVANRNKSGTDSLIGCFVNTLVFRADVLADLSFHELLSRVTATALQAYAHQQLPFEKLVQQLQRATGEQLDKLFQVVWAYQNVPRVETALTGLVVREGKALERGFTLFDLECRLSEEPDGSILIHIV